MIKLFYGSSISNIFWRIYTIYDKQNLQILANDSTIADVEIKVGQQTLFTNSFLYVVDVTKWKFTEKLINDIKKLNDSDTEIIMIVDNSNLQNGLKDLKWIKTTKCYDPNLAEKRQVIFNFLKKYNLKLEDSTQEILISSLPNDYDFIVNEIKKFSLLGKSLLTEKDIKDLLFPLNDGKIFELINYWLNGNKSLLIEKINGFLQENYDVLDLIPVLVFQLFSIKLFLQGSSKNWSAAQIITNMGISYFQQKIYSKLLSINKIDSKIKLLLNRLFKLEIDIKLQKKISYPSLIQILLEEI